MQRPFLATFVGGVTLCFSLPSTSNALALEEAVWKQILSFGVISFTGFL